MPRGTRRLQINRQQKHILLLALFLLKHLHGEARPPKRQVLNFIDLRHLIQIRNEDRRTTAKTKIFSYFCLFSIPTGSTASSARKTLHTKSIRRI